MRLPPELIDHIFSFLRKDNSALKACSEAHPLFSRLAEPYLYMDIVIQSSTPLELKKQLSENSRLLDYPRTLEIRSDFEFRSGRSTPLLIMPMIPGMSNLVSLRLHGQPCPVDHYEEFYSTFTTCLKQASIKELELFFLHDFPLSVLDNGKYVKLTLSNCTAKEEPISSFPSSQNNFETLILSGEHNPGLHFWAMHRVHRLTSLGLHDLWLDLDWPAFPGLLAACSNSLTTLHLGLNHECASTYSCNFVDQGGCWQDDGLQLPFTLSAFRLLSSLSIFGPIFATTIGIDCPLPEIIRLINTVPAIKHVALTFHCGYAGSLPLRVLSRLDWSLLDRIESNSTGSRPRIDLCITFDEIGMRPSSPESIRQALLGNEALMGLVEQGLVVIQSERTLALWEDSEYLL